MESGCLTTLYIDIIEDCQRHVQVLQAYKVYAKSYK